VLSHALLRWRLTRCFLSQLLGSGSHSLASRNPHRDRSHSPHLDQPKGDLRMRRERISKNKSSKGHRDLRQPIEPISPEFQQRGAKCVSAGWSAVLARPRRPLFMSGRPPACLLACGSALLLLLLLLTLPPYCTNRPPFLT